MGVSIQRARTAKESLAKTLVDAKGLVGLGITRIGSDYAVKVNFSTEPQEEIPSSVAGVPVQVEIVGKIRKRQ
jgi:hypothetical protein